MARGDAPSRTSTDDRGEYVLISRHGVCGRLTFELSGFVPEGFTRPGGDVLDLAATKVTLQAGVRIRLSR